MGITMARRSGLAALVLVPVLLAACGGGGATQAPGGTTAAPGGTTPPTTTAPGDTTAPPTQGAGGPAATAGGIGTTAAACELITPEEVAAALGTGALTSTGGQVGPQTFCDYRTASGDAVMTSYMQPGAGGMWSVFEGSLQTEPVSGLGDKAMFEPSTKLLFVLKGDTFFNVFIATVGLAAADALEQEKRLAAIMVGRI
jgi:hypothetical protein